MIVIHWAFPVTPRYVHWLYTLLCSTFYTIELITTLPTDPHLKLHNFVREPPLYLLACSIHPTFVQLIHVLLSWIHFNCEEVPFKVLYLQVQVIKILIWVSNGQCWLSFRIIMMHKMSANTYTVFHKHSEEVHVQLHGPRTTVWEALVV
jgi:hypothetical protein